METQLAEEKLRCLENYSAFPTTDSSQNKQNMAHWTTLPCQMQRHLKVLLSSWKTSTSTMLLQHQPGDSRSRSLCGRRKKDACLSFRYQRYINLMRLWKEIDEDMLADMLQHKQYAISRLDTSWLQFIYLLLPRHSVNITLVHSSFSIAVRFNATCRIFSSLAPHLQMHSWLAIRLILHCTLKGLVGTSSCLVHIIFVHR